MKTQFEIVKHVNYTNEDVRKVQESGINYHNNIPVKTVEEVFTTSALEGKIKNTKDAIEAMENNISDLGVEMPKGTKDLIESLKNKIRDYTIKLEEIKSKEKVSELEEIYN